MQQVSSIYIDSLTHFLKTYLHLNMPAIFIISVAHDTFCVIVHTWVANHVSIIPVISPYVQRYNDHVLQLVKSPGFFQIFSITSCWQTFLKKYLYLKNRCSHFYNLCCRWHILFNNYSYLWCKFICKDMVSVTPKNLHYSKNN